MPRKGFGRRRQNPLKPSHAAPTPRQLLDWMTNWMNTLIYLWYGAVEPVSRVNLMTKVYTSTYQKRRQSTFWVDSAT